MHGNMNVKTIRDLCCYLSVSAQPRFPGIKHTINGNRTDVQMVNPLVIHFPPFPVGSYIYIYISPHTITLIWSEAVLHLSRKMIKQTAEFPSKAGIFQYLSADQIRTSWVPCAASGWRLLGCIAFFGASGSRMVPAVFWTVKDSGSPLHCFTLKTIVKNLAWMIILKL